MTGNATNANTAAERELRDLVAERVAAVHARDAATLAARPADDVITFDVLPPLNSQGSAAVAEHMREWFDSYDGDIGYDVHQLHISAENDLGFCPFLYNVNGTLKTGDVVDMWVRATLCCRSIPGTWRIVHDHESVPFDPATRPSRNQPPAPAKRQLRSRLVQHAHRAGVL